ncbi:MAG: Type phosphodiesterase / nucleotide pyrophosphatase [Verrucomicrobiales bacterium]|nr:Type phosphodiesterase / nucleotide pyrophosphatase [Verrucomicrobiales bacterium]
MIANLAANAATGIDTNQHVILITIDGGAAYYFNDPKAPIPNLRKLAARGVVAKGMRISNPAVTWPNHTTLITGVAPAKHSVLYNGLMVRNEKGGLSRESEKTQAELIAVPTVFDFLHGKGYSTAGVNWPCTVGSKTLDITFPDVQDQLRYTTPRLVKELMALKILDDSSEAAFMNKTGAKRDTIWANTACHLLRTQPPNLMLLHFLQLDSTQHQFGPQGPEAYAALGLIDQHIGEVLQTLDETGLRQRTSILVTADHGFARVYKHIVGITVLREAGLLDKPDGKSRVQLISEGGSAMIYLHSKETKEADRKSVIKLFKKHEGVDQIIEPKDFARLGYPSPETNPGMPDLVLAAKDGYAFSAMDLLEKTIVPVGERGQGAHGYLSSNPKMNALFIAAGRGIAKGKKIGLMNNIDVAPTVAHLLGQEFPGADGKVLKSILAKP